MDSNLEEIIVTAQKRAESLQDVSVSVTALGGEKLSDFGIARLEEITAYVQILSCQKLALEQLYIYEVLAPE